METNFGPSRRRDQTTGIANSVKPPLRRVKTSGTVVHAHNCIVKKCVRAADSGYDSSSTAFSPTGSQSEGIVGSRRSFAEELWKSAENRVKRYVFSQAKDTQPLEPIGDGEHIVLRSPAALAHFHDRIHRADGSIHRSRVRSLDASWSTEIPFSIEDAINLVCVLSQLPNIISLSISLPVHMPFPFVDPIHPGLSKALATQLMIEGLAWESHSGTREMARENRVLPPDFLYVLNSVAALSNLRVLDTTVGFLTRLPARVCANVTNLSVTIISAQQNEACATIERNFSRSLRRLKMTRLFKHAPRRESPVRICALLGAKALEYLEVVDRDVTGGACRVPRPRESDVLLGTEEGRAAVYECPQLRTIVWEPSWSSCLVDIYDIERATHRYQDDMLATFGAPIELYLRVSETRGVRVALEDNGRPNKSPLVLDLEESQRWDVQS